MLSGIWGRQYALLLPRMESHTGGTPGEYAYIVEPGRSLAGKPVTPPDAAERV